MRARQKPRKIFPEIFLALDFPASSFPLRPVSVYFGCCCSVFGLAASSARLAIHASYSSVPGRGGASAGSPPIQCGISPICTLGVSSVARLTDEMRLKIGQPNMDFVQPIRPGRNLCATRGQARFEGNFKMEAGAIPKPSDTY